VHTDPSKLKLVLKNLVDNALKFTEEGTVTVRASRSPTGVEVEIADTGPDRAGGPSVIFEAFRQWTLVDAPPRRLGLGSTSCGGCSTCSAARSASTAPRRGVDVPRPLPIRRPGGELAAAGG